MCSDLAQNVALLFRSQTQIRDLFLLASREQEKSYNSRALVVIHAEFYTYAFSFVC
jgi:hypothetical protein